MKTKKITQSINLFIWVVLAMILGFLSFSAFYYIRIQNQTTQKSHSSPSPFPSQIELKTYTSSKYKYSFNYLSNLDLNDDHESLVQIFDDSDAPSSVFIVAVIKKNASPGYPDAKGHDPFTYDLDKVLTAYVGESGQTGNGSPYKRLPDELVGNQTAKVFDWSNMKNFVIDSPDFYYVLSVYKGSATAEKILSTFKLID